MAVKFFKTNDIIALLRASSENFLNHQSLATFMLHLFPQNSKAFDSMVKLLRTKVKMPQVLNMVAEIAVRQNHPVEIVKILHDNGNDLNFDCHNDEGKIVKLIHLAIIQENVEMVRKLLDLGANVNLMIDGRESLIIFAAKHKRTEVCFELIKRGASAGLALYLQGSISCNKVDWLIHILRTSPVDLKNSNFANGLNIFTYSVSVDRPQILEALFSELGFYIFKADAQGNTILTTPTGSGFS